MLTVECPHCRHRFPFLGGCTEGCTSAAAMTPATTTTTVSFDHHLPTSASGGIVVINTSNFTGNNLYQQHQVTISTQYDNNASDACFAQSANTKLILEQSLANGSSIMVPKIEVMTKHSGGGCLIQNNFDPPDCEKPLLDARQLRLSLEKAAEYQRSHSTTARFESPPSGCQELPGIRRESSCDMESSRKCNVPCTNPFCCKCQDQNDACQPRCRPSFSDQIDIDTEYNQNQPQVRSEFSRISSSNHHHYENSNNLYLDNPKAQQGDVQIQVNATVRLPSQITPGVLNSCTLSITASTSTPSASSNAPIVNISSVNNFNGGGIVGFDCDTYGVVTDIAANCIEQIATAPTSSSWISCSHISSLANENKVLTEKDLAKLAEVKSQLQMSGWYHEDVSWQQSEALLKDEPVGTWLMRDSSNKRYAFALSVNTQRGPTSIRVIYTNSGKFRLDSEPRLNRIMPAFDCPIEMMEYYVNYSISGAEQLPGEFWVDFFGTKFTKIFLSKPLIKEVRSLQHMARLNINKNKAVLDTRIQSLASSHKQFLAEYPFTL